MHRGFRKQLDMAKLIARRCKFLRLQTWSPAAHGDLGHRDTGAVAVWVIFSSQGPKHSHLNISRPPIASMFEQQEIYTASVIYEEILHISGQVLAPSIQTCNLRSPFEVGFPADRNTCG